MSEQFKGVMGRTIDESKQYWPDPIRPREGSPNIVYWVIDDTGFGQLSPFGGLVEMPTLQSLADNGLLYNNFHTTALCSPTRSCLLTGRNHHSNHMACITEIATGFPGSDGRIPFENGFLSEMLTPHGYAAWAVGKWHMTPAQEVHMGASRERWPLGRGFERYYGFMWGDTDQWRPDLAHDNHLIPVPDRKPYYHLSEDITDKAIEFIKDLKSVTPSKPFFLYLAYGANHAPHQAPKEWIDKYKGKFDAGWEKCRETIYKNQLKMGIIPTGTVLPAHDPDVPAWDSFSADEKRLAARFMEAFAAHSSHMDHQFGRLVQFLKDMGELENTLIMVVSDNGASSEGGPHGLINENEFFNMIPEDVQRTLARIDDIGTPRSYNHYPWGWAWAGDTPFRRWKRETYRGGVSDPCVVSWPAGIKSRGQIRNQYIHAIDLVPTVLDVLGIDPPQFIRGVSQSPIEGISFAYSFDNSNAPSRRETQYFEMFGHRAIYHNGWRAVCPWPGTSFVESGKGFGTPLSLKDLQRIETGGWELYHLDEDYAEAHNVADKYPEILREMISRWWTEAGKYNVLPVDGRGPTRTLDPHPAIEKPRQRYIYYSGTSRIAGLVAVDVKNRSHTVSAEVNIPPGGAEGMLICQGGRFGGWALYVKGKRLKYAYNYAGITSHIISADRDIPAGSCRLCYEFEKKSEPDFMKGKGAGGIVRLYINDDKVGEAEIPVTSAICYDIPGNLACGGDEGEPVVDDYTTPFKFTGVIKQVIVDVSGEPVVHHEMQGRIAMARQ